MINKQSYKRQLISLPLQSVRQTHQQISNKTISSFQDSHQQQQQKQYQYECSYQQPFCFHLSKQSTINNQSTFQLQNLVYELKLTINNLCLKNQQLQYFYQQCKTQLHFLLKQKNQLVQQIKNLEYRLDIKQKQINKMIKDIKQSTSLIPIIQASFNKSFGIPILQKSYQKNLNQNSLRKIFNKKRKQQFNYHETDETQNLQDKIDLLTKQNKILKKQIQEKLLLNKNLYNTKKSQIACLLIQNNQEKAVLRQQLDNSNLYKQQLKTQIQYLKDRNKQFQQRIKYYKEQLKMKMKMSIDNLTNIKNQKCYSQGLKKKQEIIDKLMIENNRLVNAVNILQHNINLKDHFLEQEKRINLDLSQTVNRFKFKYQTLEKNYRKFSEQNKELISQNQEKTNKLKCNIKTIKASYQEKQILFLKEIQTKDQLIKKLQKRIQILQVSSDSQTLKRKLQSIEKQLIITQTQSLNYKNQMKEVQKILNNKNYEFNKFILQKEKQKKLYQEKIQSMITQFRNQNNNDKLTSLKALSFKKVESQSEIQKKNQNKIKIFQEKILFLEHNIEIQKVQNQKLRQMINKYELERASLIQQNRLIKNYKSKIIPYSQDSIDNNDFLIKQCVSQNITLKKNKTYEQYIHNKEEQQQQKMQNQSGQQQQSQITESREKVKNILRKTQPTFQNFKELQKKLICQPYPHSCLKLQPQSQSAKKLNSKFDLFNYKRQRQIQKQSQGQRQTQNGKNKYKDMSNFSTPRNNSSNLYSSNSRLIQKIQNVQQQIMVYSPGKTQKNYTSSPNSNQTKSPKSPYQLPSQDTPLFKQQNEKIDSKFLFEASNHQEPRRLSSVMDIQNYSVHLYNGLTDQIQQHSSMIQSQFPNFITFNDQDKKEEIIQISKKNLLPNPDLSLLKKFNKNVLKSHYISDSLNFSQQYDRFNKKNRKSSSQNKIFQNNFQSKQCQLSTKKLSSTKNKKYFQCQTDRVFLSQMKQQVKGLFLFETMHHINNNEDIQNQQQLQDLNKDKKLRSTSPKSQIFQEDLKEFKKKIEKVKSTQFQYQKKQSFSPLFQFFSHQDAQNINSIKDEKKKSINLQNLSEKIKNIRKSNKQLKKQIVTNDNFNDHYSMRNSNSNNLYNFNNPNTQPFLNKKKSFTNRTTNDYIIKNQNLEFTNNLSNKNLNIDFNPDINQFKKKPQNIINYQSTASTTKTTLSMFQKPSSFRQKNNNDNFHYELKYRNQKSK